MKRQMFFGTMLSVVLAAGLSAQQTQPPTGQTPPGGQTPPSGQTQTPRTTPSDQSASERTMTLIGCVQAGSGGAGAATGAGAAGAGAGASTSAAGSQRAGFILTDITPAAGSGSTAAGTTGTSGSMANATSYRLTGDENLQQYVGKRVEITGSVSGRAGSGATGAAAGSPTGAGAGASEASSSPAFRVTSVKPATGECK